MLEFAFNLFKAKGILYLLTVLNRRLHKIVAKISLSKSNEDSYKLDFENLTAFEKKKGEEDMKFFSFITTLILFSVFAFAANQTNESMTTQTPNQGESPASETNSNEQLQDEILLVEDGSACANCVIIDARPFDFYSIGKSTGRMRDIEEVILDVGNTISLDLAFHLGHLTFVGQSDERSFDDTLFFNTPNNILDAVTGVVREAVRDGYERLNQYLVDSKLPENNIIVDISGNQVKIGRSDYIQEGDVFYIYNDEDYNYNSPCTDGSGFKPHLAIASVVDISDKQTTLQIDEINNGCRQVQVGDVAHMSLDSITSKYEQAKKEKRPLIIGHVPRVILFYRGDSYWARWVEDISPIIREALLDEARKFAFQVKFNDTFM